MSPYHVRRDITLEELVFGLVPGCRCEEFSRTLVAARDETSQNFDRYGDEGGLYHTICRVGAIHLLLVRPSPFSNELRFASHG